MDWLRKLLLALIISCGYNVKQTILAHSSVVYSTVKTNVCKNSICKTAFLSNHEVAQKATTTTVIWRKCVEVKRAMTYNNPLNTHIAVFAWKFAVVT